MEQMTAPAIVVFGKPDCGDYARVRDTLNQSGIEYEFRDILLSDADRNEAVRISAGPATPVVVFPDGSFQVEPDVDALVERLRIYGL